MPRVRMIGADDELARADFRDEVAKRIGGEYERIEIKRSQVLGRLLLQDDVRIAFRGIDASYNFV